MLTFSILLFLIIGVIILKTIKTYQSTITISLIVLPSIFLLLYEFIIYYNSDYRANSLLFLREFLLIICCVILISILLRDKKYQSAIVVFISLFGGVLALCNIPFFFFRYYESAIYGFDDFTQFRFLYRPLGFLSNEWVTILLCFLPFPFIGFLLFKKKIFFRCLFLIIICLLIFNVLISFSRAGFLSLTLYFLLLSSLGYICCQFSLKKILLLNFVPLMLGILFVFSFSKSMSSSIQQTYSHQRSTENRIKQWRQIIKTTNKAPYFGVGSKNYALLCGTSSQTNIEKAFTGRVNNSYIQIVLEKGWFGFVLWSTATGILIFISLKRINKNRSRLERVIDSIILASISTILFRELFFSSIFYNSGILFLLFILFAFAHRYSDFKIVRSRPTRVILLSILVTSTTYVYLKKDDNALFYAEKGLKCERSLNNGQKKTALNDFLVFPAETQLDAIIQAIDYYKVACQLSPSDAMFSHNLGWLYWQAQQQDSAYIYLSHAVNLDPNSALYHISKGLISEFLHKDGAFELFEQAILLSPDVIDSPFYDDLKDRSPIKANYILEKASYSLSKMLSIKYSSIIEAKNGKILLALGDTESAYNAFENVTLIHPNLSRPWYNMGVIEQKKGNFDKMKAFYSKSLFLSSSDLLPLSAFACYYSSIGDKAKSDLYYEAMKKAMKYKTSVHSSKSRRLYYLDTENDDVIPNGLLDYITPIVNKE